MEKSSNRGAASVYRLSVDHVHSLLKTSNGSTLGRTHNAFEAHKADSFASTEKVPSLAKG